MSRRLPSLSLPDGMQCHAIDTIEPAELAQAITIGRNIIIIDVRCDEERADGRIAASVHVPFDCWRREELHELAIKLLDSAANQSALLVFHCMYSRERAPTCARVAAAWRPDVRVSLLHGGFQAMMATLWDDVSPPTCLEGVKRDQWVDGPGRQGLTWRSDIELSYLLGARTSRMLTPVQRVNIDGLEGSSISGGCYAARYGGGDDYTAIEPILSLSCPVAPQACECWAAVQAAVEHTTDASLLRPPGYAEAALRAPRSSVGTVWGGTTHLVITRVPPPTPTTAPDGAGSVTCHLSLMLHGWLFPHFGAQSTRKASQKFPLLACVHASNLAALDPSAGREEPQWLPIDGGRFGWADQHVHRDEPVDLGGFSFAEVFFGSDMARIEVLDPTQPASLWLAAIDHGAAADEAVVDEAAAAVAPRGLLSLVVLLPADSPPSLDAALTRTRLTLGMVGATLSAALPSCEGAAARAAVRAIASLDGGLETGT